MSYTLTFFPLLEGPRVLTETSVFCQTQLIPGQNYEIYAQIDELNFLDPSVKIIVKTQPIPAQLWVNMYEEAGIERTRENAQGAELHFAYAQALKKLALPEDAHWRTKAVMAYVNSLPNDIPVLLYF